MQAIDEAARLIKEGAVIAYPTEGVWGLGCDPANEDAVTKILELKQRPVEKGLILVAGNLEQVAFLTDKLEKSYLELLLESWPGPNTWLLPDVDQLIPAWIKGKFDTVAVRVSDHPVVAALCGAFNGMIVSTSANPGSLPPALTQSQVENYFPQGVDFIVPGELGGQAGPSEIRDLMSQSLVRNANK